nr:putative ribonuclease H-like domain-containing protein [Tanacetum cinerariifolium]
MFDVYACDRFQLTPKVSHLHVVKWIFRYLKGQPKLGLWYLKDSPFNLEAFSDSDYAGASLDRKSAIGGCQFLGKRLISWQCKKKTVVVNSTTKVEYFLVTAKSKIVNDVKQIYVTVDGKTVVISESPVRSDLYFNYEDGITCLSNDERMTEWLGLPLQPSGKARKWDADAQTRFETASKKSHDPPLSEVNTSRRGHTPGSDEGRPNITELMDICTQLSNKVLALEQSRTAQDLVIKKLQKKVKRLEKKQRERTPMMNLFKIGTSIRKSLDKESVSKLGRNLKIRPMFKEVNTTTTGVSAASASVTTNGVYISTTRPRTPPTTITTVFEEDDLTISKTLVKIRSEKAKEKGVAFIDVEENKNSSNYRSKR